MNIIRKMCRHIGFDVVRNYNSPEATLLGLRQLPITTVIDVGANEGQFAKMFLDMFPDAVIHSFEPVAEPFARLSEWATEMNGRVNAHNIALGDREGTIQMHCHQDHSSSSSILRTTELCLDLYPFTERKDFTTVALTPLDDYVKRRQLLLTPEILIKLDVQGYEDRVIAGGTEMCKRAAACIVEVCLDAIYDEQATFLDIATRLDQLGYRYVGNLHQAYANDGHVVHIDAVFMNAAYQLHDND